jgi:hypothetical protein
MKRLSVLGSAVLAASALAACDDPRPVETERVEAPAPYPDAAAAEDAAVEAAAPSATDTPPAVDPGTLPADKRSSEESVQPESETLFY